MPRSRAWGRPRAVLRTPRRAGEADARLRAGPEAYLALLEEWTQARAVQSLDGSAPGDRFRILEAARVPETHFFPRLPVFVLAGLVAGLGLGLAVALTREFLDHSVKGPEDLEEILPQPLLATIPHRGRANEDSLARPAVEGPPSVRPHCQPAVDPREGGMRGEAPPERPRGRCVAAAITTGSSGRSRRARRPGPRSAASRARHPPSRGWCSKRRSRPAEAFVGSAIALVEQPARLADGARRSTNRSSTIRSNRRRSRFSTRARRR